MSMPAPTFTPASRPPRKLHGDAYILTFARRKGGIGTTTTMISLMTGLAALGYAVGVLEGDDNIRLSRIMLGLDRPGATPVQDSQTTYNLFMRPEEGLGNSQFGLPMDQLLREIPGDRAALIAERGWANPGVLQIVPGTETLSQIESEFTQAALNRALRGENMAAFNTGTKLREAIGTFRRDFDFILIDVPANVGLLAVNEIMASQYVMFLADFDPDSRYDLDYAVRFYKKIASSCATLGVPVPEPLGAVLNRYTGSLRHQKRLNAYTNQHEDEDSGRMVRPLLQYNGLGQLPVLGILPFDIDTLEEAMERRRPVHVTAPTSPIGVAMYDLCKTIEQRLGLVGPSGR